jgi:hypothetical protein
MTVQWYYGAEGDRHGPYSAQQLQALAAAGTIKPTDIVWKEGVVHGVHAARVKNLFPPGGANPPAPATSAAPGPPAQNTAPAQDSAPSETIPQSADDSVHAAGEASAQAQSAPAAQSHHAGNTVQPAAPPGAPGSDSEAEETAPPAVKPPPPPVVRKLRATAVRGASIVSQDGTSVYFRKKCTECGTEETGRSRLPIRPGVTRTTYFCRKCRKLRPVEIQASG